MGKGRPVSFAAGVLGCCSVWDVNTPKRAGVLREGLLFLLSNATDKLEKSICVWEGETHWPCQAKTKIVYFSPPPLVSR